jgi:hypothetical protein
MPPSLDSGLHLRGLGDLGAGGSETGVGKGRIAMPAPATRSSCLTASMRKESGSPSGSLAPERVMITNSRVGGKDVPGVVATPAQITGEGVGVARPRACYLVVHPSREVSRTFNAHPMTWLRYWCTVRLRVYAPLLNCLVCFLKLVLTASATALYLLGETGVQIAPSFQVRDERQASRS